MWELLTNTVCLVQLLRQKSLKFTHGLTRSLKHVQSLAAVAINREMSHAQSRERLKRLTKLYVIHRKNQRSGKSVEVWIAHLSGLKANGVNVRHRADKMEQESEKFIAKKLALMGN
jgi:hypothetical protein